MITLKKMTFLDALKERKIVVPVIQRDYAQGRDNVQAENIRKAFVQRLTQAAWGEPLNLDLVYMATQENGEESQWVPVDGQQRLTTLFLFHLYHLEDVDGLKRFSYKVRRTSAEFCEKIVEHRSDWRKQGKPPSELIRDQAWFLAAWERDPTIMGMLQTLDVIHEEGQKEPPQGWSKNITFWVYETKEDADDEYHKLNARGKPLTPFENLKAAIDEKATNASLWKSAVDGVWLDKVWEIVGNKGCDRTMFRLTLTLLLLHYIERDDETATEKEKASVIDNVRETIKDSDVALPSEDWERLMKENPVSFLEKGFSRLVCSPKEGEQAEKSWYSEEINTWWRPIWNLDSQASSENVMLTALADESTASDPLSYKEECLAYAYILAKSEPVKMTLQIEPRDWWRIVHNILENTAISSANLDSVIKLIHLLAEAEDLVTALENTSVAKEQCKEEAEKLKLLKDENWRNPIEKAEALSWQKGRINFLLCQCNEGREDNPDDKLGKFEDVLTYFAGNPEKPGKFENEELRRKWLREDLVPRIAAAYEPKSHELEMSIPCELICMDAAGNATLNTLLYPTEQRYEWQVEHCKMGKGDEPRRMEWLERLDRCYPGWDNDKLKVAGRYRKSYKIRTWSKYAWCTDVYLYTRANLNNGTAYRIDSLVKWWYEFYDEHQDWEWEWPTDASGTWITTSGNIGGGKHTFALIQSGEESYIQIVDEGHTSEEKPLKPISPKVVFKAMEELVAEVFPKEGKTKA